MQDLKDIKKLKNNGQYKYIGFILVREEQIVKTGKRINNGDGELIDETESITGENLSIFINIENDKQYFVSNLNIKDNNSEQPYGVFQKFMSLFNYIFDVEIDKEVVNIFVKENEAEEIKK